MFICLILYLDFVFLKGMFVFIIFFLFIKIIGNVLKKVGIWCIKSLCFFLFLKIGCFNYLIVILFLLFIEFVLNNFFFVGLLLI